MTERLSCHLASVAASHIVPILDGGKKYRKVFSPHEDEQLAELVERMGAKNWDVIASYIPNRTARQCRERWKFYLCPSVNRTPWTSDEDRRLLCKYRAV